MVEQNTEPNDQNQTSVADKEYANAMNPLLAYSKGHKDGCRCMEEIATKREARHKTDAREKRHEYNEQVRKQMRRDHKEQIASSIQNYELTSTQALLYGKVAIPGTAAMHYNNGALQRNWTQNALILNAIKSETDDECLKRYNELCKAEQIHQGYLNNRKARRQQQDG